MWRRQRPETDYERWQREQDQSYQPGERPQYAPSSPESPSDNYLNEHQTDDYVLDASGEFRHGQHYVDDRPTSQGHFVSSEAPAKPITSEDSIIVTARKVLRFGNDTFMGSLLLFAVLLMIFSGRQSQSNEAVAVTLFHSRTTTGTVQGLRASDHFRDLQGAHNKCRDDSASAQFPGKSIHY